MFEVIFSGLNLPKRMNDFVSMFIGVALVEEFCKYIAMKGAIYKKSEFDDVAPNSFISSRYPELTT